MASQDTGIRVRVVSKERVGVAATNEFTPEGARKAAESAKELALVSSPDPEWPGLAPAAEAADRDAFDEATASASPEERAEAIAGLVGAIGEGFRAAGAYETNAAEIALANTEGQFVYAPYTQGSINTVVSGGEGGAGFAEVFAGSTDEINAEQIGARALDKAMNSQNPKPLEPGRYDVVLEPTATSTLVGFLSYMGFGGRMIAEGRSCFSGRQGETVGAAAVSMYDDALEPRMLGVPFDFEGTPRQRTNLIKDGVFVGGVQDRQGAGPELRWLGVRPRFAAELANAGFEAAA
jgi:predicted Zn-dependent protease